MTDSEDESSQSLQQDLMSVSDQEDGASREDDMPSAELSEGISNPNDELRSSSSSASSNSSDEEEPIVHGAAGGELGVLKGAQFPTVDLDDAAMELMSGSYSEILLSPSRFKVEPVDEGALQPSLATLEGTVMKEGDMVHFIAKNLETKIRLSSPDISEASHAAGVQSHSSERPCSVAVESTFLSLLEREARCIAASVDGLTEHLAASLHTISAVTAQSLSVYKDSVCKTCDSMDANIKSMYQLMAKCEELGKAMAPIYKQAEQVKEIKKLLDIMENIS